LKPENILLESKDPNNFNIKLADFGFSRFFNPSIGLKLQLGSPLYMAPEVLQGKKYNEKIDIWAIGVMTYSLIAGVFPFLGSSVSELKRNISDTKPNFKKGNFKDISDDGKDFIK